MHSPLTVSFRRIERSGALEDRARKLGLRLSCFCECITERHITLEGPHDPSDSRPYVVKIALSVPGAHIQADSIHADGTGHKDIYLALRDAFNNAKRQLQNLHRDRS